MMLKINDCRKLYIFYSTVKMQDEAIAFLIIVGLAILAATVKDVTKVVMLTTLTVNAFLLFTLVKKSSERGWFQTVKEKLGEMFGNKFEDLNNEDVDLIYPVSSHPINQLGARSGDRAGMWQNRGDFRPPLGGSFDKWNTSRSSYRIDADKRASAKPGQPDDRCMGPRTMDTLLTQYHRKKGERNKQAIDGASRAADYYAYYGLKDDCARDEARVWWGEDDD
jgi:hypothetical protein